MSDNIAEDERKTAEDEQMNSRQLPSGDTLAAGLLRDTGDLVDDDRDTHGDAVENQQHIADAWTWYLQGKGLLPNNEQIKADDVAVLMGLLKMSRHAVGEKDVDHMRDVAGYAGIGVACMVYQGEAQPEEIERGSYEDAHLEEDDR